MPDAPRADPRMRVNARGSYLGCLTADRCSGHGCRICSGGQKAAATLPSLSVAACRIRSAACVTRARRCVRCVLWPREFPLVPALPSVGSAGTEVPLFAALSGTMPGSDCFNPFIIDSDSLLSSAAPVQRPGRIEALSGPLHGRTYVPGFLDAAEPFRPHESGRLVLPSADDKASALRMTVFRRSIALPARAATDTSRGTSRCPAHGSRWKRFVTPFLPPDSHRLSTSELA